MERAVQSVVAFPLGSDRSQCEVHLLTFEESGHEVGHQSRWTLL